MPPSSQDPPQGPRRFCAIAPHTLKEQNRKITDPQLLRFAQLINSEMRLGCTVCLSCYQHLTKLFRLKTTNARNHLKKREAAAAASMSDVSSSQRMQSSSDPSVANPGEVTQESSVSSTSNDDGPSTSTAAAAKRNGTGGNSPPPAASSSASYVSDDDDPNSNLSLNAVNGTRLPHIQPIPKRRQFVTLNKTAMDIYLAGTTGG